ncbi:hypothetical protein F3Y22_tig00112452pilonHSYRG00045 [Hibiscus syriacus]|uniref:Uncharacterized protein n=1 Tax=Hibiscus syriacus TaxID=106335 RepID=A0A6A2XXQ9_HIBSY|nr:hypothetical protein F3Y22_tig00112452pilonHSYRG00045 [Hibiscus syriacus]
MRTPVHIVYPVSALSWGDKLRELTKCFPCNLPVYALYAPEAAQGPCQGALHKRAESIVSACNAYMEGAPVGFALECSRNELDVNFKGSSTGFKIMLAKLFPKLVDAFSNHGVDCSQIRDK